MDDYENSLTQAPNAKNSSNVYVGICYSNTNDQI